MDPSISAWLPVTLDCTECLWIAFTSIWLHAALSVCLIVEYTVCLAACEPIKHVVACSSKCLVDSGVHPVLGCLWIPAVA